MKTPVRVIGPECGIYAVVDSAGMKVCSAVDEDSANAIRDALNVSNSADEMAGALNAVIIAIGIGVPDSIRMPAMQAILNRYFAALNGGTQ
ncbi:MAG: hypothetical protein KDB14_32285 [Planctomycetales bacterium]|nr:hypothetical protein [Planctomycetales bacterium]